MADEKKTGTAGLERYQQVGLVLGPCLFLATLLMAPPDGMTEAGWAVTGVAALMAVWWATEALPVPATSLIPIVALPLLGITSISEATAPYAHRMIMLLLGGFMVALSLERWNLHRRIALAILSRVGNHPAAIIAGFMGVTALLSMWVSNTASTMMMIPIALSVAGLLGTKDDDGHKFTLGLILGVAWAASIGGLGTLVGTPPNLLVAAYLAETQGITIGFGQWMAYGLPVVFVLVPIAWLTLVKLTFRFGPLDGAAGAEYIRSELTALGQMTGPEKRVAVIFTTVALSWMFRPLLQDLPGLAHLDDTVIAIAGALILFLVPSGSKREPGTRLMDWPTANRLNWGVLLLFGGGLSLANAIKQTGLAVWLGENMAGLTTMPLLVLMLAIITLVIFLTELTSNTATTAAFLPVLGAIAAVGGIDAIVLAAPAAMAASCAFMLPAATAPNAIIFGTGKISIPEMAAAGFRLNLFAIVAITALSYALVPIVFG